MMLHFQQKHNFEKDENMIASDKYLSAFFYLRLLSV